MITERAAIFLHELPQLTSAGEKQGVFYAFLYSVSELYYKKIRQNVNQNFCMFPAYTDLHVVYADEYENI